jgi:hypothetical protein
MLAGHNPAAKLCHQGLLTLPCVNDGNTVVNDHITTLNGAALNEGEVRLALLESDGPVNQVELNYCQRNLPRSLCDEL